MAIVRQRANGATTQCAQLGFASNCMQPDLRGRRKHSARDWRSGVRRRRGLDSIDSGCPRNGTHLHVSVRAGTQN
jgi:hypothetical protein